MWKCRTSSTNCAAEQTISREAYKAYRKQAVVREEDIQLKKMSEGQKLETQWNDPESG